MLQAHKSTKGSINVQGETIISCVRRCKFKIPQVHESLQTTDTLCI